MIAQGSLISPLSGQANTEVSPAGHQDEHHNRVIRDATERCWAPICVIVLSGPSFASTLMQ